MTDPICGSVSKTYNFQSNGPGFDLETSINYYNNLVYYIPRSEILEFSSVINFDIITSDDTNFHFLL